MAKQATGVAVSWPKLPPLEERQDTCLTVHMWEQTVGKVRLELAPWINHSWGTALYVAAHGLATSPIPYEPLAHD